MYPFVLLLYPVKKMTIPQKNFYNLDRAQEVGLHQLTVFILRYILYSVSLHKIHPQNICRNSYYNWMPEQLLKKSN